MCNLRPHVAFESIVEYFHIPTQRIVFEARDSCTCKLLSMAYHQDPTEWITTHHIHLDIYLIVYLRMFFLPAIPKYVFMFLRVFYWLSVLFMFFIPNQVLQGVQAKRGHHPSFPDQFNDLFWDYFEMLFFGLLFGCFVFFFFMFFVVDAFLMPFCEKKWICAWNFLYGMNWVTSLSTRAVDCEWSVGRLRDQCSFKWLYLNWVDIGTKMSKPYKINIYIYISKWYDNHHEKSTTNQLQWISIDTGKQTKVLRVSYMIPAQHRVQGQVNTSKMVYPLKWS